VAAYLVTLPSSSDISGSTIELNLKRCLQVEYKNNNNNNNKADNVYGAVIVARASARVHLVHIMDMERRQVAADPQPRPNDSGCESACRLPIGCQKSHLS